jgi:hypothetical protein
MRSILLCLASFIFTTSIAQSAILDQLYEPVSPSEYVVVGGSIYSAQTFTVGTNGKLSQIDLFLGAFGAPSGNLVLDIFPTSNGAPIDDNMNSLAHITIPTDNINLPHASGSWINIDISSSHVDVAQNDILAIVLHGEFTNVETAEDGTPFWNYLEWLGTADEGVFGKESYHRSLVSSNDPWILDRGFICIPDGPFSAHIEEVGPVCRGFRTYVEPVPEPSTLTLLLLGTIGLLFYAKRIHRRCC